MLVLLLRGRHIEEPRATVWPFGFAGVVPLRSLSVFGLCAYLVGRMESRYSRWAHVVAAVLFLLAGFGVLWNGLQTLSEVLLEYAAGGLVLFFAIWWMEGYSREAQSPRTDVRGLEVQ
jgi:hypothetical protein